jgi:hypothetical protein
MFGLYAHEGTINMQSGNLSIENGTGKVELSQLI